MNPIEALQESLDGLQAVVDAGNLHTAANDPTPCSEFNVSQLFEHIIDTHNLLITAANGEPIKDGGTPSERHRAAAQAAIDAWTERGTDGTINIGDNELPASFGLELHTTESYLHAWDLAQGLGEDFSPSEPLTATIWEVAQQNITDGVRGDNGAPYQPAVPIGEDSDLINRIAAHAGRTPLRPTATN